MTGRSRSAPVLHGAVAGGVGLRAIALVLAGLDWMVALQVPFDLGLAMVALSIAMVSAVLAAWEPVRVRLLAVLRSEWRAL